MTPADFTPREKRLWAACAEIVRQTHSRHDYLGRIVNRIAFEAIRDTTPQAMEATDANDTTQL